MIGQLYRGYPKKICQKIGIDDTLEDCYKRYRMRHAPKFITIVANGITADFLVSSYHLLSRLSEFAHDPSEIERIMSEIEPDDNYWDIGANVGTHTILPAKYLETGEVVAVEAHPNTVRQLEKNIRHNNIGNIRVVPKAFGNQTGVTELRLEGDDVGEGSHSIKSESYTEQIDVPIIRGDSLRNELPIPNVIKIDVQAAELNVLRGLSETISDDNCRTIFCEVHRRRGVTVNSVQEELVDLGFNTKVVADHGNTVLLLGEKSG
ncbi:FkbM family methyltransferase [Halobacteria archaeon AArc-m2/3/4]|uniref:FkbM family methyltransferase n=1 Tax=Natronoglomus mannanivorans TaxID=2979990 RepID=A0ABT2QKC0_9EURY|nr:FkbM family methyltransferase [Halobacteria archaeon AArc-m2/3/4]